MSEKNTQGYGYQYAGRLYVDPQGIQGGSIAKMGDPCGDPCDFTPGDPMGIRRGSEGDPWPKWGIQTNLVMVFMGDPPPPINPFIILKRGIEGRKRSSHIAVVVFSWPGRLSDRDSFF